MNEHIWGMIWFPPTPSYTSLNPLFHWRTVFLNREVGFVLGFFGLLIHFCFAWESVPKISFLSDTPIGTSSWALSNLTPWLSDPSLWLSGYQDFFTNTASLQWLQCSTLSSSYIKSGSTAKEKQSKLEPLSKPIGRWLNPTILVPSELPILTIWSHL